MKDPQLLEQTAPIKTISELKTYLQEHPSSDVLNLQPRFTTFEIPVLKKKYP